MGDECSKFFHGEQSIAQSSLMKEKRITQLF